MTFGAQVPSRGERDDAAEAAQAIVASLTQREPGSAEVFAAFWELDALPPDVVTDALADWLGPQPDLNRMDDESRRAFGLPPRPLHLVAIASVRDADVLDLGDVAEAQLRLTGASWDGLDLAAEERLDGEREGSFAGSLELRVLADATAPKRALYDVMLFAPDTGVVFEAGTTRQVGLFADGRVEVRDARVRAALHEALATQGAAIGAITVTEARVETAPATSATSAKTKAPQTTTAAKTSSSKTPKTKPPITKTKTKTKTTATKNAVAEGAKAAERKATASDAPAKKRATKQAVKKASSAPPAKKQKAAGVAKKTPSSSRKKSS